MDFIQERYATSTPTEICKLLSHKDGLREHISDILLWRIVSPPNAHLVSVVGHRTGSCRINGMTNIAGAEELPKITNAKPRVVDDGSDSDDEIAGFGPSAETWLEIIRDQKAKGKPQVLGKGHDKSYVGCCQLVLHPSIICTYCPLLPIYVLILCC